MTKRLVRGLIVVSIALGSLVGMSTTAGAGPDSLCMGAKVWPMEKLTVCVPLP